MISFEEWKEKNWKKNLTDTINLCKFMNISWQGHPFEVSNHIPPVIQFCAYNRRSCSQEFSLRFSPTNFPHKTRTATMNYGLQYIFALTLWLSFLPWNSALGIHLRWAFLLHTIYTNKFFPLVTLWIFVHLGSWKNLRYSKNMNTILPPLSE